MEICFSCAQELGTQAYQILGVPGYRASIDKTKMVLRHTHDLRRGDSRYWTDKGLERPVYLTSDILVEEKLKAKLLWYACNLADAFLIAALFRNDVRAGSAKA